MYRIITILTFPMFIFVCTPISLPMYFYHFYNFFVYLPLEFTVALEYTAFIIQQPVVDQM